MLIMAHVNFHNAEGFIGRSEALTKNPVNQKQNIESYLEGIPVGLMKRLDSPISRSSQKPFYALHMNIAIWSN
jgi:hypothetical protein